MTNIEFDIKGKPPTVEELAEYRQYLINKEEAQKREAQRCRKKRSVMFTIVMGSVGMGVTAGIIGAIGLPIYPDGVAYILGAGLLYILIRFSFIAIKDGCYEEVEKTKTRIQYLEELDREKHPNECIRYDALCKEYQDILKYHKQVVKMGRLPVLKEVFTAEIWAAGAPARNAFGRIVSAEYQEREERNA